MVEIVNRPINKDRRSALDKLFTTFVYIPEYHCETQDAFNMVHEMNRGNVEYRHCRIRRVVIGPRQ